MACSWETKAGYLTCQNGGRIFRSLPTFSSFSPFRQSKWLEIRSRFSPPHFHFEAKLLQRKKKASEKSYCIFATPQQDDLHRSHSGWGQFSLFKKQINHDCKSQSHDFCTTTKRTLSECLFLQALTRESPARLPKETSPLSEETRSL